MDTDTTFDLLSSPVRRHVITILQDSGPLTRAELTSALADRVGDATGPKAASSRNMTRRQLRIALHHNHLPRLADAGVIEYDDGTVTGTDSLERLAQSLVASDAEATSALV